MRRSIILVLLAGVMLAVVPYLGLPAFYESVLYLIFHWVALATSWNILSGYSGYFSFGHGAFYGIGMYTTATLTSQFDMPFLWTLPLAGLFAALFGAVLGVVSFRVKAVRGELFALLTLAATFVVATIVLNTPIDGGQGVYLSAVPMPEFGPSPSGTFYLLALAAAVATIVIALVIYYARFGLGLFAIHDDEDVAEVMGVPTFRYKVAAFALSCALAGVVGGIQAMFVSYVTTGDVFTVAMPLTVVLMSVLGGTRHWLGPAVGALVITVLLYSFTAGDSAVLGKVAMGVILVGVILFMPEGILGQALKYFGRKPQDKAAVVSLPPSALNEQARADAARQADQTAAHQSGSPVPAEASLDTRVLPASRGGLPGADIPASSGEPLLVARDVAKSFRGVKALKGVSLEVRRGEILGLLGPNGSGKSTFINVASGHFPATSGSIVFRGQELVGINAHRIARCGVSRTYQIPRPFAHLTVLENVALPAMFGGQLVERRQAEEDAWRWLEFTGLAARAHVLPEDLNLHQRKFLEFARALAAQPQLLMLDEVLSGLTPAEIDEAVALIQRIRAQGTTILFVEHVMRAVMALCDRIVIFNQGEVLAEGPPAEVMARPDVVSAYLGKPIDEGRDSSNATGAPAHA
ncbi:ABC transporter permease subunit [Pusillimonas noertemannii]|uniref:Amino acid/amide ABC transporter membrane protein 2 (HAAT family) /amino acid/amide ABC transporter ATP-binding protein 1 (HAAT family) n=1 Tax=Pusillimonas noertemannii TaxID=305977 RepID=A0A2U1CPE8_9BURK|nr:branched-chain amino acid ABC transporter ATP-binding protein/permease [Pusillimonas noertemannii]NYT67031.1 branched-chain amino acid ABC transporter ATP-binding protein/permease [Pusillimonas noertemannii]PVY67704.1 amino acid/amide ABC transporter membrane protein 2 (HAAT family) /amino acid/amide ABC transporter ATP-binding protein 1 (HAAT family) [Pusillimonas noertemannii]TFL12759.1 branched-chain amino acid ABC transporter ATP-binding protein/permease [Pusillimonas noertemannii]